MSVGGQVRKGERSTTIVFWDFSKALVMPASIRNVRVRELLEMHSPKLHHDGGTRAFYMPSTGSIHLPKF
ncbi:hypothetical protein XB05_19420 [Xanthomonas arboricola]|nr:hypothetical protein XB05_19420 [Xanthomonas arboricola]